MNFAVTNLSVRIDVDAQSGIIIFRRVRNYSLGEREMCQFLEKETWMRQKTSLKKCSLISQYLERPILLPQKKETEENRRD